MANLGVRQGIGVAPTIAFPNLLGGTGWVIYFRPQQLPSQPDFEMWHGSIRGPGGFFVVFLDDSQYGVGINGRINEYAPSGPAMYVRKGQTISFHWNTNAPAAPIAWIYLREPEVGRL